MGFLTWLRTLEQRAREAGVEIDRLTWDEIHRYLKSEEIKEYETSREYKQNTACAKTH